MVKNGQVQQSTRLCCMGCNRSSTTIFQTFPWAFITKHTAGMCGVGKCMLRWRKWPTDECPRCGQQETTEHIWICKGKDSLLPWTTALTRLEKWMEAVQTDPDIIAGIMNQLHSWWHDIEDSSSYSWEIQNAIDQQTDIGW